MNVKNPIGQGIKMNVYRKNNIKIYTINEWFNDKRITTT